MSQANELRLLVRDALKECNPQVTPNFCRMLETQEGYKKAEDLVINYSIRNQISVSAAIAQLESTLSDTQ
jgi:hypothetical protein